VVGVKGGNYHGADEYVELSTALQSTQALYRFLVSLCGESAAS
jgi:acetylornithine deacetylase/succinyl-diaminopimelate desuccinylase-like protein